LIWIRKLDADSHIHRRLKKPAGLIHFPHEISLADPNSEA
jgi:hypothetical protein